MEIPVLTSASTHGLRSSVGACSKPGTTFLAPNPFSGGCLKEIFTTVKNTGSASCLKDLSLGKKRKARGECEVRCKKEKYINGKTGSGEALLAGKYKNRRLENVNEGNPPESCANPYPDSVSVPDKFSYHIKSTACEDSINGESRPSVNNASSASCLTAPASGCGSAPPPRDRVKNNEDHDPDFDGAHACSHDVSISDADDNGEDVKCESMNVHGKVGEESCDCKLRRERKESIDRTSGASRDVGRGAWNPGFGASPFDPPGPYPHVNQELLITPHLSQVRGTVESAGRNVSIEENVQLVAESGHIPTFCDTGISRATPSPEHFGKNGGSRHQGRRSSKSSKTMCKYDVFLGGSCNPTTWRTDIAIPDLKKMGITYYNPQVSQWRPELLEVEYHAKENAAIMFFVIDNQTRGVSALIEVAHIAGSKRNLILVIQSYTEEKQMICGEEISQEEYEDLRNGQEVLQDLVESQGIPVFNNIRIALQRTEKLLGKGLSSEVETDAQEDSRVMQPMLKQIKIEEAFAAVATSEDGKITLKDAYLAYQLLTQKSISIEHVKYAAKIFEMEDEEANLAERILNFEEFQSLVAALRANVESKELIQDSSDLLLSEGMGESCSSYMRDIYLGGTRKDTSWKNDIAIPMLKENGLSYFNPSISEWSDRFSPIEASSINFSHILLFVITNSARSIAEMAVAGHYIGLGAKMVLCIQQLPDELTLGRDKLTESAIKDYNRGRIYLADIAKRNGVEIFRSIPEAVEYCVAECKRRRNPGN